MDFDDQSEKTAIECIDYSCAGCDGNKWNIHLAYREVDGVPRTFLITICANEDCVERRREELSAPLGALIMWDQFEITGQGHDIDTLSPKSKGLAS